MAPDGQRMGAAEWRMLLALSVLWGATFFFVKVALADLPPFTIVLARVSIAALALHVVVLASGLRLPGRARDWAPYLVMGALNNLVPFSLIFWGQTQVASGLAAVLNATTPIFALLLAHVLTRDEKLTARKLAGVAAGIAGVAVMIGVDALDGLGLAVAAQLAIVAAGISYSFAGIYGRRFKGQPPLLTAAGQLTCSALLTLPVALVVDQPWTLAVPRWETWAALAGLALLSTALAYTLYFRILAAAGATNLLLVTLLIPVSALLLGILLLGERLAPQHLVGMALILGGLAVIDGRVLAWLRARGPSVPPAR